MTLLNDQSVPGTEGPLAQGEQVGDEPTLAELLDECVQFLDAVCVSPKRYIVRPIETYTEQTPKGEKKRDLVDYHGTFYLNNKSRRTLMKMALQRAEKLRTNVFFGVNPREGTTGEFDKAWQHREVWVLWSDIDHTTVDEVLAKIEAAGLPRPTVIVCSGNGVHVYWILDAAYLIDDVGNPPRVHSEWVEIKDKKKRIEFIMDGMRRVYLQDPETGKPIHQNEPDLSPKAVWIQDVVHGIAMAIGGDHTHDLSRLLRVPSWNRKNQRNGQVPVRCRMVENNGVRHSLELFAKFAERSPSRQVRGRIASVPLPSRKRMSGSRNDKLQNLIWACGSADTADRSEMDFKLCCWCVEHGLPAAEIWPKVSDVGKFKERGEEYFSRTWSKAEAKTRQTIADRTERKAGSGNQTSDESEQSGDRIDVEYSTREHDVNDKVVDALGADDTLFQRGGVLVTTVREGKPDDLIKRPQNAPRIFLLKPASLRERISKYVRFYSESEKDGEVVEREYNVPEWCVQAIHARGQYPFNILRGIINHPVVKPDGTILVQTGYDRSTELILFWPGEPIRINNSPTLADAQAALTRLKRVIADFPFESDAHRSVWLAFLFTPLIRYYFARPICCPLFLFDASVRGSGKTMLADLVGLIICGFDLPRIVYPKDDDEVRKLMLAIALGGDEFCLFDNVSGDLGGQTLDAALTGTTFRGRILGESREISVSFDTTMVATANNCSIMGDLCRRTMASRLRSPLENPEERADFDIPNLPAYVREHRSELLADALTILRAFIVAGKPDQKLPPMGSFEDWSSMVRGPLVWIGEPDPWSTRIEFASRADTSAQTAAEVLRTWPSADPESDGLTVSELLQRLGTAEHADSDLKSAIRDLCNSKSGTMPTSRMLGKRLSSIRDRVFRSQRLISYPNRVGVMVWRVETAEAKSSVQGLQGVAGFIPATPRDGTCVKGDSGEQNTSYHVGASGQRLPQTQHHPANPADRLFPSTERASDSSYDDPSY